MPFDVSHQIAPYDEYSLQTDFVFETGQFMQPMSGAPGTPAKVLRWSAGVGYKIVSFRAQRTGLKPEIGRAHV